MHQFVRQQPELNFRNPDVLAEILNVMRFWLDKGVDGFRVDVISKMMKDPEFRDEPPDPAWDGVRPFLSLQHIYTSNLPEVHSLIHQMRKVLDEYEERMMVGEIYLPNADLMKYYGGPDMPECHLPFNFQLIRAQWDAPVVRKLVDEYELALPEGAWPNWVLGNHDRDRLATRVTSAQARVANLMLLTLRGTPTCYYGDELGMENVPIPLAMIQDPPAVNQPEIAHIVGRDPERTPMQWDDSPHAGFSAPTAKSLWLPLAANYRQVNVESQLKDKKSFLNFFSRLVDYRKTSPALKVGTYRSLDLKSAEAQANCFVYERKAEKEHLLVALNFSSREQKVQLPLSGTGKIILSTTMDRKGDLDLSEFSLSPNEGLLIFL
jgi:alpha-glucosidase